MRSSASQIPAEFDGLYEVVSQASVRELLEIDDDRYCAVLSDLKGCANSGLLSQQALDVPLNGGTLGRFRFVDRTNVATHHGRRGREPSFGPAATTSRRGTSCCARTDSSTSVRDHAAGLRSGLRG